MSINRFLQQEIESQIGQQKVLLLFGTRRVGKTHIMDSIADKYAADVLYLQGEDMAVHELLASRTIANYKQLLAGKKLLLIDEAQAISDIGKVLKLMIDQVKGITIIVSGSSSFDLVNRAGEPLTGRSYTYRMHPVAQCELAENVLDARANLETRLIYGSYPEVINTAATQTNAKYLREMVNAYLLKDIFEFTGIRNSGKIMQLLKLLAFQCGSEVSVNELANQLGISKNTVDNYLDLLSKVFVIYPLSTYSGNLRKEVTKSRKWYFEDNGIRNAIINNFAPVAGRNDLGLLWENYCLAERMKYNQYKQHDCDYYFWRTYDQQEIDLLEVKDKKIATFECTWGNKKKKLPEIFKKTYPKSTFTMLNKESYLGQIMDV